MDSVEKIQIYNIDAIEAVIEHVNKIGIYIQYTLRKRGLCDTVSLDIMNAFNSASWRKINEALITEQILVCLINILHSYLSERHLI